MRQTIENLRAAIRDRFDRIAAKVETAAKKAFLLGHADFQNMNGSATAAVDRAALEYAQLRAGEMIKDFGSRVEADLVRTIIANAVAKKKDPASLYESLRLAAGDWKTDWQRIAITELALARQHGYAAALRATHGDDAKVYFEVSATACKWCKDLHTNEDGSPRVFSLRELPVDNAGLPRQSWRAVSGVVHPNCTCAMRHHKADMAKSLEPQFVGPTQMANRNVVTGSSGINLFFENPPPPTQDEPAQFAADVYSIRGPVYARVFDPEVYDYRGNVVGATHTAGEIEEAIADTHTFDWSTSIQQYHDALEARAKFRAEAQRANTPKVDE